MKEGNQSHKVRIWKQNPSNSFLTFLHCPPTWRFSRLVFFLITPPLSFNTTDTLPPFIYFGSLEMEALQVSSGTPRSVP